MFMERCARKSKPFKNYLPLGLRRDRSYSRQTSTTRRNCFQHPALLCVRGDAGLPNQTPRADCVARSTRQIKYYPRLATEYLEHFAATPNLVPYLKVGLHGRTAVTHAPGSLLDTNERGPMMTDDVEMLVFLLSPDVCEL